MAEVKLYKKLAPYVDKDGKNQTATNLFVMCGDQLVPIEVKYFEDKETHIDKNYRVRKTLISAFADLLPEREKKADKQEPPVQTAKTTAAENNGLPF